MMTDEEVKKGLECCASFTERIDCFNKMCPYTNDCYSTIGDEKQIFVDSRALINRLEAEKEEVRKETAKDIINDLFNACDSSPYDCVEPSYIVYLAKKYGVEVEE